MGIVGEIPNTFFGQRGMAQRSPSEALPQTMSERQFDDYLRYCILNATTASRVLPDEQLTQRICDLLKVNSHS